MEYRRGRKISGIVLGQLKEEIRKKNWEEVVNYDLNKEEREYVINKWINRREIIEEENSEEENIKEENIKEERKNIKENIERILELSRGGNIYYVIEVCNFYYIKGGIKDIEERNKRKKEIIKRWIESKDLGLNIGTNIEFYKEVSKKKGIKEEIDIEEIDLILERYRKGSDKKRRKRSKSKTRESIKRVLNQGGILVEVKENKYIFNGDILDKYIKRVTEKEIKDSNIKKNNVYIKEGSILNIKNRNKVTLNSNNRVKKIELSRILEPINLESGYFKF